MITVLLVLLRFVLTSTNQYNFIIGFENYEKKSLITFIFSWLILQDEPLNNLFNI